MVKTVEDFGAVKDILDEIHEKTPHREDGASYIYRGEPELYPKTSSKLYRDIEEYNENLQKHYKKYHPHREIPNLLTPISDYLVQQIQRDEIEIARSHIREFDPKPLTLMELVNDHAALGKYSSQDVDLLTEIQHLGGSTVLIDFTRNPDIALYFACRMLTTTKFPDTCKESEKCGRVIIMPRSDYDDVGIITPKYCNNRVMTQFSVFVLPGQQGYIDAVEDSRFKTVNIPDVLKPAILQYLETNKGITDAIIFNDIHGYIEFQEKRGGFNPPTE